MHPHGNIPYCLICSLLFYVCTHSHSDVRLFSLFFPFFNFRDCLFLLFRLFLFFAIWYFSKLDSSRGFFSFLILPPSLLFFSSSTSFHKLWKCRCALTLPFGAIDVWIDCRYYELSWICFTSFECAEY